MVAKYCIYYNNNRKQREKYFIFMINFISNAIFRQFQLPLSSEILSIKANKINITVIQNEQVWILYNEIGWLVQEFLHVFN